MKNTRHENIKLANNISLIGNIFLLFIKMIIGFLSKSQAMISDAFNSASDIFATILSSLGERISSIPEDDTHNFGHGKAEYLFSLFIGISMVLVSIKLVYDSIVSIIIPHEIKYQIFLIIISIITIIVKILLYIYTNKISKCVDSILIVSLKHDHLNDIFSTMFTLISIILTMNGIKYVDAIVGCLIAIVIFITGIKIFLKSFDILMDKSIDDKTGKDILDIIEKYDDIKKINHFSSKPVGYKYLISVSIFVDGNMSTFKSHEIADKLEHELNSLDRVYLAIIHVNPFGKERKNSVKKKRT